MALAAARLAEGQHALAAIHEGAFQKDVDVGVDLARQPLPVEGLQGLLQGQVGSLQGALDAVLTAYVARGMGPSRSEPLPPPHLGPGTLPGPTPRAGPAISHKQLSR